MRIGEFVRRISAIAEQLDYNRAWELAILAAFRKWLGGNRAERPSFARRGPARK